LNPASVHRGKASPATPVRHSAAGPDPMPSFFALDGKTVSTDPPSGGWCPAAEVLASLRPCAFALVQLPFPGSKEIAVPCRPNSQRHFITLSVLWTFHPCRSELSGCLLSMNRNLVAASRQSAAIIWEESQRRSAAAASSQVQLPGVREADNRTTSRSSGDAAGYLRFLLGLERGAGAGLALRWASRRRVEASSARAFSRSPL
jgi:hypothetical protein